MRTHAETGGQTLRTEAYTGIHPYTQCETNTHSRARHYGQDRIHINRDTRIYTKGGYTLGGGGGTHAGYTHAGYIYTGYIYTGYIYTGGIYTHRDTHRNKFTYTPKHTHIQTGIWNAHTHIQAQPYTPTHIHRPARARATTDFGTIRYGWVCE